jgi:hypothetical protein
MQSQRTSFNMNLIAVDPGLQGAICVYLPEEGFIEIHDVPVLVKTSVYKGKRINKVSVDFVTLLHLFDELKKKYEITYVILEKQIVMPRQGGVSNFTTGYNYGALMMASHAAGLIIKEARAADWKRALRVPADKILAIERATTLIPVGETYWEVKKRQKGENNSVAQRSGRAEAAMLAVYAVAHLFNQKKNDYDNR